MRAGVGRDGIRPEQRLDPGQRRLRIDVAHDHEDRVARSIPGVVERAQGLRRGPVEGGSRPERIPGVAGARVEDILGLLEGEEAGMRNVARDLLLDCAFLEVPVPVGQQRAAHAAGFDVQDDAEVGGRCGEDVLGRVVGREGVVVAAHLPGDFIQLRPGERLVVAEHHVLQRMRGAGKARRRLIAAGEVGHLRGDRRRQGVAHDDHAQAIAEGGPQHVAAPCGRRCRLRIRGARMARAGEQPEGEREAEGQRLERTEVHRIRLPVIGSWHWVLALGRGIGSWHWVVALGRGIGSW